jgi:hypothetical protein
MAIAGGPRQIHLKAAIPHPRVAIRLALKKLLIFLIGAKKPMWEF